MWEYTLHGSYNLPADRQLPQSALGAILGTLRVHCELMLITKLRMTNVILWLFRLSHGKSSTLPIRLHAPFSLHLISFITTIHSHAPALEPMWQCWHVRQLRITYKHTSWRFRYHVWAWWVHGGLQRSTRWLPKEHIVRTKTLNVGQHHLLEVESHVCGYRIK